MPRARFCSGCGEEIKAKRAHLFRAVCIHCAAEFRRSRLIWMATLALLLAGGFALGRYTTPSKPFYFIGTPTGPGSNRIQSSDEHSASSTAGDEDSTAQNQQPPSFSPNEVETLCGAPTKSRRPCRRKVRGGGYCYQHRDKFKPKIEDSKQKAEGRRQ